MPKSSTTQEVEQQLVLELSLKGKTQRQIVDILHDEHGIVISQPTVMRRYRQALESIVAPETEAARTLQLARIEEWLGVVARAVDGGNLKPLADGIKLLGLQAKLTGTEKPRQVETKQTGPAPNVNLLLQAVQPRDQPMTRVIESQ